MKRRLGYVMWLMSCMLCLSACHHKEFGDLSEPTVKVRVKFDWSQAPDANPRGMCVYFYQPENGRSKRVDFPGMTGGMVDLPIGKWHVMTYNNDTEGVWFMNDDDYYRHHAFTREGNVLEGALGNAASEAPPAKGKDDERVVITPDMLWGQALEDYEVAPVPGSDEAVITLVPKEMVCIYTYEIRNVTNLNRVVQMCGALSSMAGTMVVCNGEVGKECVTLPVESNRGGNNTIVGKFYTFGYHPENEERIRMTLYVWMDDGRKWAYGTTDSPKWDVTEQIHEAPNPQRVHFIIDGLDLPVSMGDGAFRPSTDDWGNENYDIEI